MVPKRLSLALDLEREAGEVSGEPNMGTWGGGEVVARGGKSRAGWALGKGVVALRGAAP